ncbi:MAG TPA: FHA domain-containing protein [Ktedonobacteraceae bacterium]|nr:FHA domain-containing protein [Ktedonobacteraceae bacterium]
MDARFYNSEEIDLERLANDLENMFRMQGYEVQQIGNKDQMMVQLKKGGDLVMLLGLQAALSVILQHTAGGTIAMIGQQKWLDKAAVGAVGLVAAPVLWPLMITAGAGAIRQASLGNQVMNVVDGMIRQQYPRVQVGPVPVQIMPQIQQQWAPPSSVPVYVPSAPQYVPSTAKATLRCPNCNTPYEEGDTFCSGCGRTLAPKKNLCPNCKAEIKPGLAFCPKCGASIFQPQPSVQQTTPAAPAYTPPAPSAPTYTPPKQPAPQPKPYVPPTPQQPPVTPKPAVTYVPGSPKPDTTPKQPPRPQTPIYTPPAQPPTIQTDVSPTSQTMPARKPILARPSNQPASSTTPWGKLIFSDGKEVQLISENALIGRSDNDISGVNPEVDLNGMEGADTTSRIHATLEHIGSTYTVTDLNSTNSTRINGKRLEPDKATPINDGDKLSFGKVTCTFKKA